MPKIKELNIEMEKDRMYYCKGDPIEIHSSPRKGESGSKRVEEETEVERKKNKLYYIKNGDLYEATKR